MVMYLYVHYITSWKFWLSEKLNDFIYSYKHIIEKTEKIYFYIFYLDEKKTFKRN